MSDYGYQNQALTTATASLPRANVPDAEPLQEIALQALDALRRSHGTVRDMTRELEPEPGKDVDHGLIHSVNRLREEARALENRLQELKARVGEL